MSRLTGISARDVPLVIVPRAGELRQAEEVSPSLLAAGELTGAVFRLIVVEIIQITDLTATCPGPPYVILPIR